MHKGRTKVYTQDMCLKSEVHLQNIVKFLFNCGMS